MTFATVEGREREGLLNAMPNDPNQKGLKYISTTVNGRNVRVLQSQNGISDYQLTAVRTVFYHIDNFFNIKDIISIIHDKKLQFVNVYEETDSDNCDVPHIKNLYKTISTEKDISEAYTNLDKNHKIFYASILEGIKLAISSEDPQVKSTLKTVKISSIIFKVESISQEKIIDSIAIKHFSLVVANVYTKFAQRVELAAFSDEEKRKWTNEKVKDLPFVEII